MDKTGNNLKQILVKILDIAAYEEDKEQYAKDIIQLCQDIAITELSSHLTLEQQAIYFDTYMGRMVSTVQELISSAKSSLSSEKQKELDKYIASLSQKPISQAP